MEERVIGQTDVICPAYKEEKNLRKIVSKTLHITRNDTRDYELNIVVNDEDPSRTPQIADNLSKSYQSVSLITHLGEPAFGEAIKQGITGTSGDAIIIMMSDQSDDPKFLPNFVEQLENGYDVVYGSRFKQASSLEDYGQKKLILNRIFNHVSKWFFGLKSNDLSNAFKAYYRPVIDAIEVENLRSSSFEFTIELALKAHLLGFTQTEIAVTWKNRDHGESRNQIRSEGIHYLTRFLQMSYERLITSRKDSYE